jgi:hypothetical protein
MHFILKQMTVKRGVFSATPGAPWQTFNINQNIKFDVVRYNLGNVRTHILFLFLNKQLLQETVSILYSPEFNLRG